MELSVQRAAALLMIIGSVIFIVAAFSPISRVFGERSHARKLEIIRSSPGQWVVAQTLFAGGALVAAVGVAVLAFGFREQPFAWLVAASGAILLVGAIPWAWHVYERTIDPAAFTSGAIPVWYFASYTFLTQAGLVLLGFALWNTGMQDWVGWMLVGGMGFLFLLTLIFRDMPPFVYYLLTLAVGIMLYRTETLVSQ